MLKVIIIITLNMTKIYMHLSKIFKSFVFYHSDKMDKQVLTSSLATGDANRYAVGVLRQGRITVTVVLCEK